MRKYRLALAGILIGVVACENHKDATPRDDLSDTSDMSTPPSEDCDGSCVDIGVVDAILDDVSVPSMNAHLAFDATPVKSDIGSTATLVVTVHNDGAAPATQLAVTTAPAAPFAFAGGAYPGTSGSCGTSLTNGDSCVANLTFAPTTTGAVNGGWTISYFDGQSTKSLTVTLTATGVRAGTLDPSFGNGGQQIADFNVRPVTNPYYNQVAVQPDGKILVAGFFNSSSTRQNDNCFVARFLSSGQLDTGFGANGTVNVHGSNNSCSIGGIVALAGGKILIGGERDTYNLFAIRLNADGSLDPTFGRGGVGTVGSTGLTNPAALVIRAGGQILIGAPSSSKGYAIGQLNSDGTVDNSFGTSGLAAGSGGVPAFGAMTVTDNDDIIIGGRDSFYFAASFYVARLTPDGTFDKAFTTPVLYNAASKGAATSVFATGNHVYAAGFTANNGNDAFPVVVRYVDHGSVTGADAGNNDGTADTTFNGTGVLSFNGIGSGTYAIATGARWSSSNSNFYLFGEARSTSLDAFVARYNLDGTPDTSFGTNGVFLHDFAPGADDETFDVASSGSGLLAVGSTGTGGLFARLSTMGQLDGAFTPSTALTVSGGGYFTTDTDNVLGVDAQSDGKIIVSGGVLNWNAGLIRFNSDGSLDNAFGTNGRQALDIRSSFVAASTIGSTILAAGNDDSGHLLLARLHASDGSLDTSFHSAGLSTVLIAGANNIDAISAVILPDGSAYVGGSANFTGLSEGWVLTKFGSDGSPDASFNGTGTLAVPLSGSEDQLQQIALDGSGRLLAAGMRGNQTTLIRYNSNGVADPGFNGGNPIQPTLNANFASAASIAVAGSQIWLALNAQSPAASGKIGQDGGDCVLLRYTNTGTLDMTFQSAGQLVLDWGGVDTCDRVAIGPDGKVVIAGTTGTKGGLSQSQVITRLNGDGSLDANFGTAGVTKTSTADLRDCVLAIGGGNIYTATQLLNPLYGYQLDLLRYLY